VNDTDEPGSYTLIARVNFEGEETEAVTLQFEVAAPAPEPVPVVEDSSPTGLAVGLGVGGVVLLAGAGFVLWRRRKEEVASAAVASPEKAPHEDLERL